MRFRYTAYTTEGVVKGVIEATTLQEARERLPQQRLRPLALRPLPSFPLENLRLKLSKVKRKETITFFRQMATMVEAGIHLVPALELYTRQTRNPLFRSILRAVQARLQRGEALSPPWPTTPRCSTPSPCASWRWPSTRDVWRRACARRRSTWIARSRPAVA